MCARPVRSATTAFNPVPQIADFVNHGASLITPVVAEKVLHCLPMWKAEFAQINEPKYPHLVDQLEFLADVVEDFAEDAYQELPYTAYAQAVFALIYAHKKGGIIPHFVPNLARADDSSVVRCVLIQNETAFSIYATSQQVDWAGITSEP